MLSTKFISATKEYSTFTDRVPAPYIRRSFTVDKAIDKCTLTVCGLGFYEFFLNGEKLTKGLLAPYISNPDDILYYDVYDIKDKLREGKNTIGFILGNGMLNSIGGHLWDFDKAPFRSAPKLALALEGEYEDGETFVIECDDSFRCHPSHIFYDDLRIGEFCDRRNEIENWADPDYDDSGWNLPIPAETPRGVHRICKADPIVVTEELAPIAVRRAKIGKFPGEYHWMLPTIEPTGLEAEEDGWLYEFKMNACGLCRLKIKGEPGQKIVIQYGEVLDRNGDLDISGMNFLPKALDHRDVYVCRGGEEEIWMPSFTYHGFRYCIVLGLRDDQATEDLLTYVVMNSDIKEIGDFSCSNEVLNKLQSAVKLSDRSNFYYFPTDCPHREKNGWTGDAVLSAEHMMMNFSAEGSYREWLNNIRRAQREDGAVPGIVPTTGWGFAWGNGPGWDSVLVYLPYYIWRYRGDKEIIRENAAAMMRHLHYLCEKRDEDGFVHVCLGEWCQTARWGHPTTPLKFTDTVLCVDIARKAAICFDAVGMKLQADFARSLSDEFLTTARKHLIDHSTMIAYSNSQTAQAMALFYGIFEEGERPEAFRRLVEMIEANDGLMDVGVLGGRVLYRVLSQFGRTDLAYKMVTDGRCPSYAQWINEGATTLYEEFLPDDSIRPSLNHHFWGDISGWMIENLAGLVINPDCISPDRFLIAPKFVDELDHASASHKLPKGTLSVSWRREGEDIYLTLSVPEGCKGEVHLESDMKLFDGCRVFDAVSGEYRLIPASAVDVYRRLPS
ncbi:MAG: family 78 glycoside hydrolase catalytic domain [Clostridia bacterium]|nr:family 78 glycoside hydrolase catalytic domain [Clostridia bacterium]